MKKIKSLYTFVLIFIILMSGCAPPVAETQVPVTETKELPTEAPTLQPTPTQKMEPTSTPTDMPTPTPTPEPILWCEDIIEGCYFIGSEIARIFAFMTKPCFDLGGECYPPVEECSSIPPSVVHVRVEDWAKAWEAEVKDNPEYSLLDPNLYDSQTQYCFVDEGIASMVRETGLEDFQANKSCLDNENMPCDVYLLYRKIDCEQKEDNNDLICEHNLLISESEFVVDARWVINGIVEMSLKDALLGNPVEPHWFRYFFGYVLTSEVVGFDPYKVPPSTVGIAISTKE